MSQQAAKIRVFPILLVFLTMGFTDGVGPFVSLAKSQFQLSTFIASLVPFVGLGMFGLLSVPAGLAQDRLGKKTMLLAGLTCSLLGVLNASFGLHSFARFLLTVVLLGIGATILQVAGNPMMREVSEKQYFARNLVAGQFVKSIGSLSAPMIPALAARYYGASWQVVFPIYSVALVATLVMVGLFTPHGSRPQKKASSIRSCLALLGDRSILLMTLAIFFYVGAEISVSAGIPLLLKERFGLDVAAVGLFGTGLFLVALTAGRFSGSFILSWIAPEKFLKITCVVAILGLLTSYSGSRWLAAASFVVIGFGFANIFPLVFSLTIERHPERENEISGLMVSAIVGGAILPLAMGFISDHSSMLIGLLVPIAAILYVTAVSMAESYGTQKSIA
ncbi:MAG: MFS transporter [Terracidiphilus sp.]|nr:MFS transporter [Terracidiphilus sp.]